MTVGSNENFEIVVVYLPERSRGHKLTSGLELVGIFRATAPENFAIGNTLSSINCADIKKIGRSKTTINSFHLFVKDRCFTTQEKVRVSIKGLVQNAVDVGAKKFKGGCQFLLNWFIFSTLKR